MMVDEEFFCGENAVELNAYAQLHGIMINSASLWKAHTPIK